MLLALGLCIGSGLWDWPHRGDVRAGLKIAPDLAGKQISATLVWRRRDAQPEEKRVLVTTQNDTVLSGVSAPLVEQHSGVVVFTPPMPGVYYCYYLPYTQSGIGHITFAWDPPSNESSGVEWQRLPSLPQAAISF